MADDGPKLTRRRKDKTFIKAAYVVKGWSAQQCADHFAVDVTTVKKWASKEGWTAERHRITTKGGEVANETIRAGVEQIVASHVTITEQGLKNHEALGQKIFEAIEAVEATEISKLRQLSEIQRSHDEGMARVIEANRLVRGLDKGVPSEPKSESEDEINGKKYVTVFENEAENAG